MKIILNRVSLVLLIISGAVTGFWAYFATRNWYDTFPGFGMSWLPQLGPYNEHLAKDTGAMYIAFTVLSLIALLRIKDASLVRTVGGAWLVFNLLHFIYHMTMLGMYKPSDQIANVIALSLVLILSIILVIPGSRRSG